MTAWLRKCPPICSTPVAVSNIRLPRMVRPYRMNQGLVDGSLPSQIGSRTGQQQDQPKGQQRGDGLRQGGGFHQRRRPGLCGSPPGTAHVFDHHLAHAEGEQAVDGGGEHGDGAQHAKTGHPQQARGQNGLPIFSTSVMVLPLNR